MATISQALHSIISASDAMNTLDAVYVQPFPANPTLPLAEYQVIAGAHNNRSAPSAASDKYTRFQIDTWAEKYSEGQAVKEVFDTLFDGYQGTVDGIEILSSSIDVEFDLYDADAKLYRYACGVIIFHEGA